MSRVPAKIGKYPITEKLAEGGMGAVYKAQHPTLERPVILKQLTLVNSHAFLERFKREASLLMDFRNEYIVQVYDHFNIGSNYFLVMEYVEGIDLAHLIARKRYISNEAAMLIFSEISQALQYAHEHNVIHRDIKAANVMISNEGKIKLLDFGVATTLDQRESEDLTTPEMTLGTPAYMSPEQIENPGSVDRRADIYSMGVLLYLMVTGKKPFRGGFTPQVINQINKGKYVRPRKINPKIFRVIAKVIRKAMHHKKERRMKSIGQAIYYFAPYVKKYSAKEAIQEAIRKYIHEDVEFETSPQKKKREEYGTLRKIFVGTFVFCLIAGLIASGLYTGYQKGLYYKYFQSEQYGALKITATIRKGHKPFSRMYLNAKLYRREKNKKLQTQEVDFDFHEIESKENSKFYRIESAKLYLKEGNYRFLLDLENERFQQAFYLAPMDVQRQTLETREGKIIPIRLNNTNLHLPLKLNYKVYRRDTDQNIQKTTNVAIFHDKQWKDWKTFRTEEGFKDFFRSGKKYRFRFSQKGYYTHFENITAYSNQTTLNLDIPLVPKPGVLFIKGLDKNFTLLINNSPYYLSGGRLRKYQKTGPFSKKQTKIFLPPGQYFLTLINQSSLFNNHSETQKITLEPGRELKIRVDWKKNNAFKIRIN